MMKRSLGRLVLATNVPCRLRACGRGVRKGSDVRMWSSCRGKE